jgi:hypothetical protein
VNASLNTTILPQLAHPEIASRDPARVGVRGLRYLRPLEASALD